MALVVTEKVRPNVTVIRLNRPERLNAMSFELITELCDTCETVGADNRCWVVILTGEGRGFCSGLDLEDPGVIPGIDEMALSRVGMLAMSHFSKVVPALRAMPQPVIAAINGCAYTGIVNGLTSTELGASYLLPRTVGLSRSNDMLLTGRKVNAREAERMGLVSRIYPDDEILDRAVEAAETMCEFSAFGLQMTKKVCWANVEAASLTAAIDLEDRNQLILGNTENLVECITARKEKRKPVYTDLPRTDMGTD
jgi:enoyl-CoA hydratase